MVIPDIVQHGDAVFMQWDMTMMCKRFPSPTLHRCSKLTPAEDSLVIEQRDDCDLSEESLDNVPRFGPTHRQSMHKKFG